MTIFKLGAAALFGLLAAQAAHAGELPHGLRPAHVIGPGVYVTDLAREKDWYMSKLGMSLVRTIDRNGKPFEHLLGLDDGADAAVVVLAQSVERPAGPNLFVRVILSVPDAKGLAAWLKTQDVDSRELVAGVAYMVTDPEGNRVELYTPPKP